MTQTSIASVSIERLKVTRTQEGKLTGLPREPGKTHEWRMKISVNGQVQWWENDEIETGGEYKVNCSFPLVPLIDGKLTIDISGAEQDLIVDTTLSSRSLTLRPAVDCPYGVHHIWVTSPSSGYYGTPPFVAEEGLGDEGGFDFRISINPGAKSVANAPHDYAVLIHERDVDQGYWVSGMESFTRTIDQRRGAGQRLSRIATCETNPGQLSFSDVVERTYIGVFEAGRTDMPFWELGLDAFNAKLDEHWNVSKIRPTDIYVYNDKGNVMVGGTFDTGNRTELVSLPRTAFEAEFGARSEAGQGLIALDSYGDGRERRFVGLFEHGIGGSICWIGDDLHGFRNKDAEFNKSGWRLTDFCTYNDAGTELFSGVWRPGDFQTWLLPEPDWSHLVSRIAYNWSQHYQVVAIDAWCPRAAD